MNNYILENSDESKRLNYQSRQRNYDPSFELTNEDLALNNGGVAIDAGCGNGILAKMIAETNIEKEISILAIDSSIERINEARGEIPLNSIDFRVGDLKKLDVKDESADLIVCRFVYEHLSSDCQTVTNEFYRVLKPNGRLIIIDADGVLYNLQTENIKLKKYLRRIETAELSFDGFVCPKIPRYLLETGFIREKIKIKSSVMNFYDLKDLSYEIELWEMRLRQIRSILEEVIGKENYENFSRLYLEELSNPKNFLYYTKHIFTVYK